MKNTLTPYVGHLVKVNVATDDKGKGGVFLLANVTDEVVVLRLDRNADTGALVYNLQHVIGLVPQRQTEKLGSGFKKSEVTTEALILLANAVFPNTSGTGGVTENLIGLGSIAMAQ